MSTRDKFLKTIQGENHDIPVFCPAIYDYKVNFSDTSLNLFGQSEREFVAAAEKEINLLKSEVLTCGYDIYNIEAEAIEEEISAEERNLSLTELYTADEAFTSGTMGELTPILEADGRLVGSGNPGPLTKRLQDLHRTFAYEHGAELPF